MIGLPRGLSVFIFAEPVDMRKSFHTLSALVEQQMKRDVLEGDLFLFVSRNRKRAKVLYFDGTGLCLLAKKLESGQFSVPWKLQRHELSLSELALFIEGSEATRYPLSPPLLRKVDLQPKFPQETCQRDRLLLVPGSDRLRERDRRRDPARGDPAAVA